MLGENPDVMEAHTVHAATAAQNRTTLVTVRCQRESRNEAWYRIDEADRKLAGVNEGKWPGRQPFAERL